MKIHEEYNKIIAMLQEERKLSEDQKKATDFIKPMKKDQFSMLLKNAIDNDTRIYYHEGILAAFDFVLANYELVEIQRPNYETL